MSRTTTRGLTAALTATGAVLALAGCNLLPTPDAEPGTAVGFDQVQQAVIQLEARGTFVDPQYGGYEGAGRGSGFIISADGLAVTNNHVVVGAGTINVWRGGDQSHKLDARVLGASECLDIAVVQLEKSKKKKYPYLEWHKGDITTGSDVYAAGFPLGDPTFTMTRGIVSKADIEGDTAWASIDSIIEHDARIRPGNSGGPLVDSDGKVVGVNYAGNDTYDTNLAIHRDEVLAVLDQLTAGEDVLSLGINATALSDADGNGLGVWVSSVKSGSAADKAGVLPGDLLTRMEGVTLGSDGTLRDYCDVLRTHGQDATLSIELYRPSEEAYYRGQVNSDRAVEPVSVLGGGQGGVADGDFHVVSDRSGSLQVEVPAAWTQVDGSPWTDDAGHVFAHIDASADLAGYARNWGVSGVSLYASQQAYGAVSPDALMSQMSSSLPAEGCSVADSDGYDDGWHVGGYTLWQGCGGSSMALVLTANSSRGGYLIMVVLQAARAEDLASIDRILGSFMAQF